MVWVFPFDLFLIKCILLELLEECGCFDEIDSSFHGVL
jgi:hypothetical protein